MYRMLHQPVEFDKYIIVGGYMFQQLQEAIEQHFSDLGDRILLVYNEKYAEYGSGYSLYKGLEAAIGLDFDELVFAEGDLFVDRESFQKIFNSKKDVVTSSPDPIFASKAVVFYFDTRYKIHYIYDTGHHALEIKEPFLAIHNSGQIWKFARPDHLRLVIKSMTEEDWQGTNLVLVQRYFQGLEQEEYEIISFREWVNCNTVQDFEKICDV